MENFRERGCYYFSELYPNLEIQRSPYGEFADIQLSTFNLQLFHGGWGKISAAATTQYVIDHFKPDLLINLGACGGFAGRIETGTIILVERTLVYDIIEQMGDGAEAIEHYSTKIDLSWLDGGRKTELSVVCWFRLTAILRWMTSPC